MRVQSLWLESHYPQLIIVNLSRTSPFTHVLGHDARYFEPRQNSKQAADVRAFLHPTSTTTSTTTKTTTTIDGSNRTKPPDPLFEAKVPQFEIATRSWTAGAAHEKSPRKSRYRHSNPNLILAESRQSCFPPSRPREPPLQPPPPPAKKLPSSLVSLALARAHLLRHQPRHRHAVRHKAHVLRRVRVQRHLQVHRLPELPSGAPSALARRRV